MPFEKSENKISQNETPQDDSSAAKRETKYGVDKGQYYTGEEVDKELKRRDNDPNWINEQE